MLLIIRAKLHRAGIRIRRAGNSALTAATFAGCGVLAAAGCAPPAMADATMKINDDTSISVGIGLRGTYTSTENGAPNGTSYSNSFAAQSVSPNFTGRYKIFKIFLHYDKSPGGPAATGNENLRMLDGIGQIEPSEEFNIWMGRMLVPTDRGNLYGAYYSSTWSPPVIAGNYPQIFGGRDDGAMVWGTLLNGKLNYSAGAFNGHNRAAGLGNQGNSLLYAGRLQVNFWDAETGYWRPSSYLGTKDILSVALAGNTQSNGVGTAAAPHTLSIWSADALFEKKLAGGYVPTLEAIYYKYNLGGKLDCNSGEPGSPACPVGVDNVGGQVAGNALAVSALFMFPQKVGWGQFQPWVRYQKYNRDVSQTTNKGTDYGLNYLIDGFNMKIVGIFTKFDDSRKPLLVPATVASTKQFLLGVQFQY